MARYQSVLTIAVVFAAVGCLALVLPASAGTTTSALFGQLVCTDSACTKDCVPSFFNQGACYPTVASTSAVSWCESEGTRLKVEVFPFSANCTQYSYYQSFDTNDCSRGQVDYVEYMCPSSKGFAAGLVANASGTSSRTNSARFRADAPVVVIPASDARLVNAATLSGVVFTKSQMRVRLNANAADVFRAAVSLSTNAVFMRVNAADGSSVIISNDVCADGIISCGSDATTEVVQRLVGNTGELRVSVGVLMKHLSTRVHAASRGLTIEFFSVSEGPVVLMRLRL